MLVVVINRSVALGTGYEGKTLLATQSAHGPTAAATFFSLESRRSDSLSDGLRPTAKLL